MGTGGLQAWQQLQGVAGMENGRGCAPDGTCRGVRAVLDAMRNWENTDCLTGRHVGECTTHDSVQDEGVCHGGKLCGQVALGLCRSVREACRGSPCGRRLHSETGS